MHGVTFDRRTQGQALGRFIDELGATWLAMLTPIAIVAATLCVLRERRPRSLWLSRAAAAWIGLAAYIGVSWLLDARYVSGLAGPLESRVCDALEAGFPFTLAAGVLVCGVAAWKALGRRSL